MDHRGEYMTCHRCGCSISWHSNNEQDEEFSGVFDKLRDHFENSPCSRDYKIGIVLGTIKYEPNVQEFFQKNFNYTKWLERVKEHHENLE